MCPSYMGLGIAIQEPTFSATYIVRAQGFINEMNIMPLAAGASQSAPVPPHSFFGGQTCTQAKSDLSLRLTRYDGI